jgi:hypothetical protein
MKIQFFPNALFQETGVLNYTSVKTSKLADINLSGNAMCKGWHDRVYAFGCVTEKRVEILQPPFFTRRTYNGVYLSGSCFFFFFAAVPMFEVALSCLITRRVGTT